MPDADSDQTPFDATALQALEAKLSAPDGMDIAEFLATLDEHYARPRSADDVQAHREGRKPWKKLVDEVAPVAGFLRHAGIAGRIRFPLDDQPPDAWLHQAGSDTETGIEVSRVLARSKFEAAKTLQVKAMTPGFLGLPDNASATTYSAVLDRGRILKSREHVEKAIEASIAERLAGKSDPKFEGQILLLAAPLGSAPGHDWEQLRQKLELQAKQTAFDQIFLIDEARSKPPLLLFERSPQDIDLTSPD